MRTPIRVLLAEDHRLVRAGIRSLLTSLSDIEVVAEAGNGQEVLQLVKQLQPDVELLNIAMPGLNGLEVARIIKQRHPKVQDAGAIMAAGSG